MDNDHTRHDRQLAALEFLISLLLISLVTFLALGVSSAFALLVRLFRWSLSC
ncbi:hypothetical protein QF001_003739 [Paraburkholderia youngii]|uniref:hypothetical protein n=1 Tax=Paraburkholderia youngii TaxID=2782701 RepID=UPI003D234D5C